MDDRPSELRLWTLNVGNGRAWPRDLVPTLAGSGADVIALQELHATQATALRRELAGSYPHQALFGDGLPGKGVLSRVPLLDVERFVLHGDRPQLRVTLDLAPEPWTLISVHMPLEAILTAPAKATGEIEALAEIATAQPRTLLAGDFNAMPGSSRMAILRRAGLRDAFRAAGAGFGATFPVFGRYKSLPVPRLARIDYVWHTPDLEASECRVAADAGSDHRPVATRLRLGAAP